MENSSSNVESLQTKIRKAFTLSVILAGSISVLMLVFFSVAMFKNQTLVQPMVDEYNII